MENLKRIKSEVALLSSLGIIAQVYQESSILKIRDVRSSVLNTREFLNKLSVIYYDVKTANTKRIAQLLEEKSKHAQHITKEDEKKLKDADKMAPAQVQPKAKTLIVFISANTKLYGEIIRDVYDLFINTLKNEKDADIMIVGRLGEKLFKEGGNTRQHLFFEIPDTNISPEELKPIIFNIVKYEKVIVFHGKFNNLMNQTATVSNITGQALFEQGNIATLTEEDKITKFLFEPSLETIVQFFETQIFAALFRQTIHESELARYSSRVTAMEEALQSIKKREKKLIQDRRRLKRIGDHKKQVERFAGMKLWKH